MTKAMTMLRSLAACGLLAAGCAVTPGDHDAARRDLAPTGVLRAAINVGNAVIAQRDPQGGPPRGMAPDLAREIARRLQVPVAYVLYDNASKVADDAPRGAWDVAFLAIDPARAAQIDFTSPYAQVAASYLVRQESPLRANGDVDREGVRIAAGERTAYTLFLARTLRHAQLVTAPTSDAALRRFLEQRLEAVAGIRGALADAAARDPSLRLLDGHFMTSDHAVAAPRGRSAGIAWLQAFTEEAKANGFVSRSITASGVRDAEVAPAVR
jgi:polar amino acid transport system substrate-binding protein